SIVRSAETANRAEKRPAYPPVLTIPEKAFPDPAIVPAEVRAQKTSPRTLTRKLAFAAFLPRDSRMSTIRITSESDKRGAALKRSIVDTRSSAQWRGSFRLKQGTKYEIPR